jgi:hypothetical protein
MKRLREFPVHPLGVPHALFEKVIGFIRVKPGIGSQEVEKIIKTAIKACLINYVVHFSPYSLHFIQTNLVNFLCTHRQGGMVFNQVIVVLFTIGQINTAESTSTLDKSGAGPALNLRVDSGTPLKVDSQTKVANLNADKLDNLDSSALGVQLLSSTNFITSTICGQPNTWN